MRLQWSETADKLHLYIFHCEVNNPHPHERRCLHYWTNPHALPRNFLRPIKICCSDEMTGLLEKKYALFLHGDWFTFHHTIYSIFNNYSSNKFCKLKNRFLSGQDPLLHSSTMGVHFLSRPLRHKARLIDFTTFWLHCFHWFKEGGEWEEGEGGM